VFLLLNRRLEVDKLPRPQRRSYQDDSGYGPPQL
jgi:hypothetical protein